MKGEFGPEEYARRADPVHHIGSAVTAVGRELPTTEDGPSQPKDQTRPEESDDQKIPEHAGPGDEAAFDHQGIGTRPPERLQQECDGRSDPGDDDLHDLNGQDRIGIGPEHRNAVADERGHRSTDEDGEREQYRDRKTQERGGRDAEHGEEGQLGPVDDHRPGEVALECRRLPEHFEVGGIEEEGGAIREESLRGIAGSEREPAVEDLQPQRAVLIDQSRWNQQSVPLFGYEFLADLLAEGREAEDDRIPVRGF